MKIKIVHKSKKLFNVHVDERTTIGELKRAIGQRMGIPSEDQVLTYQGVFLEDTHPLRDYQLPDPNIVAPIDLFLRANSKKQTPLRVSLPSGNTVNISIHLDAKVSELRTALEGKCDSRMTKSSGISFIFDHFILDDNKPLEDYGIKKNSCILAVKRLPDPNGTTTAATANNTTNGRNDSQPSNPSLPPSLPPPLTPPKNGERSTFTKNGVNATIKLTIIHPNGPGYVISFLRNSSLREVSEQIEQKTGIPATHQSFALKEGLPHVVDLSKTLEELGLNDGDTLYMVDARHPMNGNEKNLKGPLNSPPSNNMNLIFRDPQNEYTIPLPFDATVQDAINALRTTINGRPGPLWLKNTVDGNYMQDYGNRLTDLGLRDGMVIEYVFFPARTDWAMK
ncbi:hypothetical protein Aperf_G00000023509 [Anoplocephala perfoliata]